MVIVHSSRPMYAKEQPGYCVKCILFGSSKKFWKWVWWWNFLFLGELFL